MTTLNYILQRWRIVKASPYIAPGCAVLNIGSSDGALYKLLPGIGSYTGIDPLVRSETRGTQYTLIRGTFPAALPADSSFDVITLLAVLEHIPAAQQRQFAIDCYRHLNPGGYVVITVPSPQVDALLAVLRSLRLIQGMSLDEHYGIRASETPSVLNPRGSPWSNEKISNSDSTICSSFKKISRPGNLPIS